ncbi:MAG: hypothetical protein ABSE93_13020 [Terriglobia bacterium]|jgi:hypothetical protein
MSKVYRRVLEACWGLGLICTLASVVVRLLTLQYKLGVTARGGMILAAVFFLGALATGEARKTLPPS